MLRTKQYSLIIYIRELFNTSFFEKNFKKLVFGYPDYCEVSRLRLLLHGDCRILGEGISFPTFSYVNGVSLIG